MNSVDNDKGRKFLNFIIVSTLFVIGFLIYMSINPPAIKFEIVAKCWEREITIEKKCTFFENDWELPFNARLLYTNKEIKNYTYENVGCELKNITKNKTKDVIKQVKPEDGSEPVYYAYNIFPENNNEKVPVYENKYYYEIDRWVEDKKIKTSGKNNDAYWDENYSLGESERESRTEQYWLLIKEKEDSGRYNTITFYVDYDDWLKYNNGDILSIKKLPEKLYNGAEEIIIEN